MSRKASFILTVAATLITSPASTAQAIALPQSGTGGGSGSATTVRTRCSNCGASQDAERRARETLLIKIDSLRWEIDNRHLSNSERERVSREMTRTVLALQRSLDASMRSEATLAAKLEVDVASEAQLAASEAPGARAAIAAIAAIAAVRAGHRNTGYIGATFDGPHAEMNSPNEVAIRFYQYPRIALVEPSSPAERAGVVQGDTLLALNGTDVTQTAISLTKLLIPETRIVMRVRRDGDWKDVNVTVGRTPDYYVARRQAPVSVRAQISPRAMPGEPPRWGIEPVPPVPPMPSVAAGTVWIDHEGVAGARVETISEGLGRAVGVREGVLVVRVRPGTPAYRSGLRDGDVIVGAGGRSIASVTRLRGIVGEGHRKEGVKLVILRERRERDLTLRW